MEDSFESFPIINSADPVSRGSVLNLSTSTVTRCLNNNCGGLGLYQEYMGVYGVIYGH